MTARKHSWVIDSIEEFVASIEVDGKRTVQLPQWFLPRDAKPGDVLAVSHDVSSRAESRLSIVIDREATRSAMESSARQVSSNRRSPSDPGGDITL